MDGPRLLSGLNRKHLPREGSRLIEIGFLSLKGHFDELFVEFES